MFNKYNSIDNSYQERAYNNAFFHQEAINTSWNVTEKLDGTNFSFIVTKDGVKPGKRSGVIHDNEKFFGYQDMYEKMKNNARNLYNGIKGDPEVVQIFGEFVGPGILNRVDYKEKEFYLFDIMVDGEYLDFGHTVSLAAKNDFKLVPVLKAGSIDEIKAFHDDWMEKDFYFNSTITLDGNHGKMILGEVTNASEGFVIKPNRALYATTGSRVILKCKTSKFTEQNKKKTKKHVELSVKDSNVLYGLTTYVTESRVYSVVSKFGEVTTKDFGKILGLLVQDIREEWSDVNGQELHELCDSISSVIQELNKACAIQIREIWLDILG